MSDPQKTENGQGMALALESRLGVCSMCHGAGGHFVPLVSFYTDWDECVACDGKGKIARKQNLSPASDVRNSLIHEKTSRLRKTDLI